MKIVAETISAQPGQEAERRVQGPADPRVTGARVDLLRPRWLNAQAMPSIGMPQ